MRRLCSGIVDEVAGASKPPTTATTSRYFRPDAARARGSEGMRPIHGAHRRGRMPRPTPRLAGRKGVQAMPMVTPSLNLPQPASRRRPPRRSRPRRAAARPRSAARRRRRPCRRAEHHGDAEPAGDERDGAPATRRRAPRAPATSAARRPAPAAPSGSIYDSLKNGISTAVDRRRRRDRRRRARGRRRRGDRRCRPPTRSPTASLELPFAAVAKACDAAGALIDEL